MGSVDNNSRGSDLGSDENDDVPCGKEIKLEKKIEKNHCGYLNEDQVLQYMKSIVEDVNEVTKIPKETASILLNHSNWNTDDLLEDYFGKDTDTFFGTFLNVVNPFKEVDSIQCNSPICQVCLESSSAVDLVELQCGHNMYCRKCWDGYLSVKIIDEGMGNTITCLEPDCPILIDYYTCSSLITNSRANKLYRKIITNSFIERNPLLYWCMNPKCDIVMKTEFIDAKTRTQTCSCGTRICCGCLQMGHAPISCEYLEKWNEIKHSDEASINWGAEITKQISIFDATIKKSDRVLYVSRYLNYKRSFELEQEVLRSNLKTKRRKLKKGGFLEKNLGWLEEALNIVLQCRQTLSYTYAFGYYLCDDNEFFILQANQVNLHKSVENLSECLKREMDICNYYTTKHKIENLSRYCDERRIFLENHVYEGEENGWWNYFQES